MTPIAPTVLGRQLWGARAAPRRFGPTPAAIAPSLTRVGLFETSSDVNACVRVVETLVDCIDGTVTGIMRKRYSGVTFSSLGMTPKCAASGTTKASVVQDSFDGVSGTVNVCEGPEFDDDNRLYRQWAVFRADFRAFVQSWNDSLGILSADDYRRCQAFGKDANAWLDRWKSAGFKVPTCLPVGKAAGVDDTLEQIMTIVKWTVAGSLGLGAVYVIGKLL